MSEFGKGKSRSSFEPRVLAFCCNWCSYAGADLAGVSRIQYSPNVKIVRVMCSGRIDPTFVIEAFLAGADAVLVLGCHLGECHYLYGNYEAVNMMNATLAARNQRTGCNQSTTAKATIRVQSGKHIQSQPTPRV